MAKDLIEAPPAVGDEVHYPNRSSSIESSNRFREETNAAQRAASTNRNETTQVTHSAESDVLVMSPLSAWKPTGKFVEEPAEISLDHSWGRTDYKTHATHFVPDGGKVDPFEGIDVHKKLGLKDPSHSSMFELLPLKQAPESKTYQNSLQLSDAKSFANAAEKLFDRVAPGANGRLSDADLEKLSHDTSLPETEREVAAIMKQNHVIIKGGITKYFSDIEKQDVTRLAQTAEINDISRANKELHNPVYLADACADLLAKHEQKPLSKDWLEEVSRSTDGKFTERERATAELLRENYTLFASLDGQEKISALDVGALKDEGWWTRVLASPTAGEKVDQISDPKVLEGSAEPYKRQTPGVLYVVDVDKQLAAEKREADRLAVPYTSSSGSDSGLSGIEYGALVYVGLKLLGNDHAGAWALAAGAAKTYERSTR